jgi:hypothetical protein
MISIQSVFSLLVFLILPYLFDSTRELASRGFSPEQFVIDFGADPASRYHKASQSIAIIWTVQTYGTVNSIYPTSDLSTTRNIGEPRNSKFQEIGSPRAAANSNIYHIVAV